MIHIGTIQQMIDPVVRSTSIQTTNTPSKKGTTVLDIKLSDPEYIVFAQEVSRQFAKQGSVDVVPKQGNVVVGDKKGGIVYLLTFHPNDEIEGEPGNQRMKKMVVHQFLGSREYSSIFYTQLYPKRVIDEFSLVEGFNEYINRQISDKNKPHAVEMVIDLN